MFTLCKHVCVPDVIQELIAVKGSTMGELVSEEKKRPDWSLIAQTGQDD